MAKTLEKIAFGKHVAAGTLVALWFSWILLGTPQVARATHAAGADLTYTSLGGLVYQIDATFYRDCGGSAEPGNVTISYKSVSCGYARTVLATKIANNNGIEITMPCTSSSTTCNGGMSTGLKKWVYRAVVTLPAACSDWVFSYRVCCRNCTVNTIQNPCASNSEIYVEATLNNLLAPGNSSPVFSNMPIAFVCLGQNFNYNQGVFDTDGDSISYELITPKISATAEVTWLPPSTTLSPLASSTAFSLNPVSGDINFTPSALQIGILAVRVNEFRNGQLIGSTIRDMQVYTQNCSNTIPATTGINGTGSFMTRACVGQPLCFTVSAQDVDSTQTVSFIPNNPIAGSTITQSAGTNPSFEFCWTPQPSDDGSLPHIFTVTVRDDACPINGVQTFSFTIFVNGPSVTATAQDPACINAPNGTATATISSHTPVTCSWNTVPVQTTATAVGLAAGTYTVTVTDTIGCTASAQVTLNAPPDPVAVTVTATGIITCQSGNSGTLEAFVSGGMAPYSFAWSNGAVTSSLNGMGAGTYTVTVTDAAGCSVTGNASIPQASGTIAVQVDTLQHVTCFNGTNGSADITVSGGQPPYSYAWSNGTTAGDLQNVSAGNYSVLITDSNGCSATVSVQITQPTSQLQFTNTVVTDINCYGAETGSIELMVSGGTQPYSFSWNTGVAAGSLYQLTAGDYSVLVTDGNGCTLAQSFQVTQPASPLLGLTTVASHVSCFGENSGNVDLTVNGGTMPYQYLWSHGATTPSLSMVAAGSYQVTITDSNGCTAHTSALVNGPPQPLSVNAVVQPVFCFGSAGGAITVSASGGTAPYSYEWGNGSTSPHITGLQPGSYTVTVTDAHNCYTSISETIPVSGEPVTVSVYVLDSIACNGDSSGYLEAGVTGGDGNYTYLWNTGATTSRLQGLPAGIYSVTVTDGSGCSGSRVITLDEPERLEVASAIQHPDCLTGNGGSVSMQVSGGTPPYLATWANGGQGFQLTGLQIGIYAVTVTDASGCSEELSFELHAASNLQPEIAADDTVICAGETATLAIDSVPGATYQWYYQGNMLNGATGMSFLTPAGGIYQVQVTTSCGTFTSNPVRIEVKSIGNVSVNNTLIICPPETAQLQALGGDSYEWSPSDYMTFAHVPDPVVSPPVTTQYSVTITNAFGCKTTLTTEVAVVCDSLLVPTGFSPNGDGTNDGYVIDGIENYPGNKLWVYNRWGKLVFKAKDYMNSWDGVGNISGLSEGIKVPSGTYFFILDLNDGSKPRSGYLIIKGQ